MKNFGSLLFAIVLCHEWSRSEATDAKISIECVSQSSCEDCLEANSFCAWCSDWSYSNSTLEKSRCNKADMLKAFGCPEERIVTAESESMKIVENSKFQDVEVVGQTPVQLRPQKVRVKIRPNSKITVPLSYRPAKASVKNHLTRCVLRDKHTKYSERFRNYPLDLYYLMDLTWSMKDDKETLISLGWNMTNTINKFTSNFRFGFGSYADKPLMPYVFPGHEDNPCKSERARCAPLYSFQHHLMLTDDIEQFVKKVNYSSVTGNVDNLEGGLDGIVEAIVCQDIGWGQQARKIILVATNGLLHFAGEGKLGGAVSRRQDSKCHLDEHGRYSLATKYDYPSVEEVWRLLQKNKVNLIFAVTEDRRPEYESMAALLEEKAEVATLTSNSSNILEIIESAYHKLISRVVLRDNSSSPLRLEYFSNCGGENACDGIREGREYDFKLVFSFDKCPRNESLWKQTVVIEDALASEASKMVIDVQLLCGCNCEQSESSRCHHGTYECGLCKCDIGWSGDDCNCDETSPVQNKLQCVGPNATNTCSERGECICGSCVCDQGYRGQFCECSACDKWEGAECAGKGTCNCGVCQCIKGWKGNACQCPWTDYPCIAPGTEHVCSDHGYCDCGECRCNVTATDGSKYRGTYCESSSISVGGNMLCPLYNPCVNATIENPRTIDQYCRTNVSDYSTERVDSVDIENMHYCFVKVTKERQTCIIHYLYEFQKNNGVLLKIGEKTCNTPIDVALLSSAIIVAILVGGLGCLLIWKCWTSIKDKREYEKFELERKRAKYNLKENPLFKPPISVFRVPSICKED